LHPIILGRFKVKKLILAAIAALTISSSAHAFIPQTQTFVNREVAVVRVWNISVRPIVCSGYAFGRTWNGVVLNAWMSRVLVYPGASVDVYVHSNFYDPMVQAWAQIDCGWY
jgi:hypothetical protein